MFVARYTKSNVFNLTFEAEDGKKPFMKSFMGNHKNYIYFRRDNLSCEVIVKRL